MQTGVIQGAAGFFTYFIVFNDYGFKPLTLFGLASENGVKPNESDVYNPSLPWKGNTNYGGKAEQFDWNTDKDNNIDLRLFYYNHPADDWSECRWGDSAPSWWTHNYVEGQDICYHSEALRYAQTAFLVNIVILQIAQLLACKTRSLSISQQGMKNNTSNFGLVFEVVIMAILCYVPYLNIAFGSRMLASPHFGVPAFPFFAVILFYDEGRKSLLRAGIDRGTNKVHGWVAQNTYY
jgi:sodium/potassium-transporting ATPase subunit alpha